MNRIDYVLIAIAIQESADKTEIAYAIAAVLAADNPRFDRDPEADALRRYHAGLHHTTGNPDSNGW